MAHKTALQEAHRQTNYQSHVMTQLRRGSMGIRPLDNHPSLSRRRENVVDERLEKKGTS